VLLLALLSVVASGCSPTPVDAFGPFGRGMPPVRAKIGTGHVLTGVVLSSVNCKPLRRARVEFMQSNPDGQYTRRGSATVFTDRNGRFRFEGPFPTQYEGLPPHIHIRVVAKDHLTLVTRYVVPTGEKVGRIVLVLRPAPL
jgi:protocatechuate 3,4-dioxygenase beta subunit